MDLDDYLASRGNSWKAMVEAVAARVNLQADDILVATGSLVDGLGNTRSDIDFFLITDRTDVAFTSLCDIALEADGCHVDIRTVPLAEATDLVARFSRWAEAPREPRSSFCFTRDERRFFHGLATGRVANGGERLNRLREPLLANQSLARHKLDWAAHLIGVSLPDLAGFQSEGDSLSLLFWAQELLGLGIDALLAGRGESNPARKWRMKLIERGGDAWEQTLPCRMPGSLIERLLELYRTPDRTDLAAVTKRALEIATVARSYLAFAERGVLSGVRGARLPRPVASEAGSAVALPALDFDFVMQFSGQEFVLYRLGDAGWERALSDAEFFLLSLFDGATPLAYARLYAAELDPAGNDILDELLRTTRDMHARIPVDERDVEDVLCHARRVAAEAGQS